MDDIGPCRPELLRFLEDAYWSPWPNLQNYSFTTRSSPSMRAKTPREPSPPEPGPPFDPLPSVFALPARPYEGTEAKVTESVRGANIRAAGNAGFLKARRKPLPVRKCSELTNGRQRRLPATPGFLGESLPWFGPPPKHRARSFL